MNNLHQVLIVDPRFTFKDLAKVMKTFGWQHDRLDFGDSSLIKDEPEVACWSLLGQKPFVTYTFNPVVKMRVLDVAGVPPSLRQALGTQLPLLNHKDIEKLFESNDIRERLLGLWAAQEVEEVGLIEHARKLENDSEPILALQAREVCERLQRINQARKDVLVQMRIMEEATPAIIRRMNDEKFIQTLKPDRNDLEKIFDAELIEVAETAIQQLYGNEKLIITISPETSIKPFACPAGLLRWPNMLSEKFPGGYRDLAGWMNPARIWITWKLETQVSSDQTATVTYDGLVWLDDHWCWLPKIFRALGPYLLNGLGSATRH